MTLGKFYTTVLDRRDISDIHMVEVVVSSPVDHQTNEGILQKGNVLD